MAEYGVLSARNIRRVSLGSYTFNTWYGNGAYFANARGPDLGIDASAKRKSSPAPPPPGYWLDTLHVCPFCFKYSADASAMAQHIQMCRLHRAYPPLGTVVYADMAAQLVIKRVRGFRHELFCQNLALFGKLFLDDKLVYYNVAAFDFYVVYGADPHPSPPPPALVLPATLRPMGFFSKECNAWDADNNLACLCVFPPYQRLHLGSLLVEFLYALARVTPGQARLGPEFPLSPYGKLTYLRFWAKRLAFLLCNDFAAADSVSLRQLADATGFRKDDCLLALESMDVLACADGVVLDRARLARWCAAAGVDTAVSASMLNEEHLLI